VKQLLPGATKMARNMFAVYFKQGQFIDEILFQKDFSKM